MATVQKNAARKNGKKNVKALAEAMKEINVITPAPAPVEEKYTVDPTGAVDMSIPLTILSDESAAPAAPAIDTPLVVVEESAEERGNRLQRERAETARASLAHIGMLHATGQGKGSAARLARIQVSALRALYREAASAVREEMKPAERKNTGRIRREAGAIVQASFAELLRAMETTLNTVFDCEAERGATGKGGHSAGQGADSITGIIDGAGALSAAIGNSYK